MARTQQDWFSIFDYQRRLMEEKLALLYRFEQFLQQLPAAEYTEQQKKVMATDIDGALQSLAYLEKCQRAAAAEKLKLGLDCCKLTRREKSRNRNH